MNRGRPVAPREGERPRGRFLSRHAVRATPWRATAVQDHDQPLLLLLLLKTNKEAET